MNIWDILLIALLAAGVALALRRMIRLRKSGGCSGCSNGSGCAGGCPHCASAPPRRH